MNSLGKVLSALLGHGELTNHHIVKYLVQGAQKTGRWEEGHAFYPRVKPVKAPCGLLQEETDE